VSDHHATVASARTERTNSTPGGVILEVRALSKSYGGVRALIDVDLRLHAGEVLGLVGDNGAGKTTLVNVVAGVIPEDAGEILLRSERVRIKDVRHARKLGIQLVPQNLALIETLDVASNLFLNSEPVSQRPILRSIGWLSARRMNNESEQILGRLHARVPSVRQEVSKLSGGQRHAIAIGRALTSSYDILLLDEPTGALGVEQTAHVLSLVEHVAATGTGVVLVTHNLRHVIEACDRVVVLRHGRKVEDAAVTDITERDLVHMIAGTTTD
jgi:ABC-type sugar transport system ATPase subunit